MIKHIIAFMCAAALVLMPLSGCVGSGGAGQEENSDPTEEQEEEVVYETVDIELSIQSPAADGAISVPAFQIQLIAGSTAIDALSAIDLPVVASENSDGFMEVDSIGDISNSTAGRWSYTLNGEPGDAPSSIVVLEEGDVLVWIYE